MLPAASINDTDSSLLLPDQTSRRFTLAEILSATHNFDEKLIIGSGGFGNVYRCLLRTRSVVGEVAIKRLDFKSDQGATEFEAEVKLLSKLRHSNLVPLIGYCNEGKEMVLIYEFMPNGTLKYHLREADCDLSWLQRLKICIGAARALDYLHTGTATQQGIIHRDVKTSNILLDVNFAAKVSDFGLAKIGPINQTRTDVSTRVKGTFGYMDPCYFFSGKLTRKSDVYAFGVVLFEVLSGKQAVDSTLDEDQWSLAAWVQDQIKEGKLNKIIDSRLMGQISKKCLKEFVGIAGQCLHSTQPKQRPTMAEVVVRLESILSLERELTNSVVDGGGIINKLVRSLFTGKADLMPLTPVVEGKSEVSADHIQISNNGKLRVFTIGELVSATNNFKYKEHSLTTHEQIYRGWVDETTKGGVGLAVYVMKKRLIKSKVQLILKPEEFNHPNFVRLLGYCLEVDELFFVHELIPYASLDNLLYGGQAGTSLTWAARLKIALGAAQSLAFVHQRNQPAYSQFKTTCILVNPDFSAWLLDSETSGTSYSFKNDAYYAAPEWFRYQADIFDCRITMPMQGDDKLNTTITGFGLKSEVYSFGVVLLEILSGMKVVDVNRPHEKQNLVKWATPLLEDVNMVNLRKIMDPQLLHNNYPPAEAFKLAILISNCLQQSREKRPSMEEIVYVLYNCYDVNLTV